MYSIVSTCLSTIISQTLPVNNLKTFRNKNVKFSGYDFQINANIYQHFHGSAILFSKQREIKDII